MEVLNEDGTVQPAQLFRVQGTGYISKADGTKVPITLDGMATAEQLKEAGLPVPGQGATE